jgi:D-arabinose 1-dehydrogenase-like Zn-dependent alcohol dehydrogenase
MLQMTVVPAAVVFRNQSVQGTLVSNMADVDETLNFAKRGRTMPAYPLLVELLTNTARQTAPATHSCGDLQIQRSVSSIEEWQGSR